MFTQDEISYCNKFAPSYERYAATFAAKEALSKALGTGFSSYLAFKDIEISHDTKGKPIIKLLNAKKNSWKNLTFLLTITHTKDHAIATVIAVKKSWYMRFLK